MRSTIVEDQLKYIHIQWLQAVPCLPEKTCTLAAGKLEKKLVGLAVASCLAACACVQGLGVADLATSPLALTVTDG
jgi:hypothetical protein